MAVSLKDFFTNAKEMRAIQSLSTLAEEDTNAHRMPVVYGEERFFASRAAAWGGFFIANKPWGYLDVKQRKSYFHQATAVFNKNFPTDSTNGGHMIVTNQVHSAEDWRARVVEKYADSATPAFPAYIRASQEAIERNEFFNKQTYLMVRLGERGDYKGFKGFVRQFMDTVTVSMGLDDAQPDEQERALWTNQATQTHETLRASWLQAQYTTRDRIEWLVRHLDTPGLPTPDLSPADEQEWGIGKWQTTLAAYTEEVELGIDGKDRYKCVKFDAPTGTGVSYSAYLALAHIPEKLHYSANWMHHASTLDFPVDISLHFEVVDSERAAKEISKPIHQAENQYEEDVEAGFRPDDLTMQKNQTLRDVKLKTQTQRDAMVNWQCVFSVSAPTKEALLKKVARLRRHYTDIDFALVCPNNDQRELFYQSLPGSDIIVNDWIQRTSAAYIGAAQPWLTSTVGSMDGFSTYQGYTVVLDANGTPQKGSPMFYDTQDIVDAQGKAPTEAVIGNPGAGKTVSRGLKVVHEDALKGITQFVWDPKGDFRPLAEHASQLMINPRKVNLIDIRNSADSISLDAFAIAEVSPEHDIDERRTSAIDIFEGLSRKLLEDPQDRSVYSRIISTAVKIELEGGRPTMRGALERMRQWGVGDLSDVKFLQSTRTDTWINCAQTLADHLDNFASDSIGRLLFLDPSRGGLNADAGSLTIFVAIGMEPTAQDETPTTASTIADVVSGCMADFIRSLLYRLPDQVPKSATFDEWHVIRRTRRAASLLDWLRRMGRSKRCIVRQLSQSANDVDNGSLSAIWAGWVENKTEAEASCKLVGIEANEQNIATFMNLGKGEFMVRDGYGRVNRVKVEFWDDDLLDLFRTEATHKANRPAGPKNVTYAPAEQQGEQMFATTAR
jgi:hypothetical protein